MTRSNILKSFVIFGLLLAVPAAAQADPRYIVGGKDGGAKASGLIKKAGGNVALEIAGMNAAAAELPPGIVNALQKNPNVEYVEIDAKRYLSGDGTYESVPYGITMVQADQLSDAGAGNRTVCIIDSGYSKQHVDLQTANVTATPDPGTGDPYFDDNGHGTHVAGTIAGLSGNGKGVVGVNPSGNLRLHIVKVFTAAGWAYSSTLANAAQICADNGANVISMSLGGSQKSKTEDRKFKALNAAGILSIAAAGNDGNTRHSYPASYGSVMSVAAIDANKAHASFSQVTNQVEISAPGVAVLSSTPYLNVASVTVGGATYNGIAIENAATGTAAGALVNGGLCDSVGSWTGMVVLCQRGTVSFYDKVINVQNGGGTAALIYNNEAGALSATLGDGNSSTIPALGFSMADGQAMTASFGQPANVTSTSTFPASGWEAWDGTSMATPHVAGVAALVWSYDPTWTNAQIRTALTASAEDLGDPGRDNYYGYGLVQAKAALNYLGGGGTPSNNPPTASFTRTCTDLACSFDASASSDSDGTIVSYAWNFGDGSAASGATASHTFAASGSYTVTLTVTDDAGDSGAASQTVTVSDGNVPALTISNVSDSVEKGGKFTVTWTTSAPADTAVIIGSQTFGSSTLTTSHSVTIRGTKKATYSYTVRSTDAYGQTATAGPFSITL